MEVNCEYKSKSCFKLHSLHTFQSKEVTMGHVDILLNFLKSRDREFLTFLHEYCGCGCSFWVFLMRKIYFAEKCPTNINVYILTQATAAGT